MFRDILLWAAEKRILFDGNNITQTAKLAEEVGEIASAVLRNDKEKIKDGIGDCVIVLTSLAYLSGLRIEDCIQHSYDVVKNRTGEIVGTNFVKSDDLP